jgi:tetratricopeptide (TPR) repeat protein
VSILRAEGQAKEAQQILNDYVANSNVFGAYMMRATYLANEGEFELAEKDYKKLTTFTNEEATGYQILSNFYIRNEKLDQAVLSLEEGISSYPTNLVLKRGLMKILFRRANPEDRQRALDILTSLEEQLPQDPELMKLRAFQILEDSIPQSVETAKEKLENVIKLEPTAVDAHLVLVGIAMQEGQYETARDCAIRAVGSNPNNLALLSARGRAELALDNTQMAAELAHQVLQEDSDNIEARDLLVAAALSSRDRRLLEEAIPELEAYCQTKEGSSNITAIVTLADLYRFAADMDQAEQRIEQAERIDPNSQTVIHARFLWLVTQRRFDELSEISSTYLSAKKQNPKLILKAASILSASDSMKLREEGLKLFEHAVTLSPILVDARLGLASTLYQTGVDAERAKKIYQELLEQYPDNIQVLNDLAWIFQEHDHRYETALELVDRGLSLAPDNLYLLDTRGTILLNVPDRLADARTDFERIVELSPPDTPQQAKALLQLGRICAQLNDLTQAKQHLERALEIDREIDVFTTDERSEIMRIIQRSGKFTVNSNTTSSNIGPNKPH